MALAGGVAIVTGGGTGIGEAICQSLVASGAAAVVVNYSRSLEDAELTAESLRSSGVKAITFGADVSVEAEVSRLVDMTVEEFGRLDVLVNCAGTTKFIDFKDLSSLTDESLDQDISGQRAGGLLCLQERSSLAAANAGAPS